MSSYITYATLMYNSTTMPIPIMRYMASRMR